MALRRYYQEPPYRTPLLDPRTGLLTIPWLQWLQEDAKLGRQIEADAAYNPASIAAGASAQATVAMTGVSLGDYVIGVSFSAPNAGILFHGQVTAADEVTVTLTNVTGGAIDLAAGTLRVLVRMKGA